MPRKFRNKTDKKNEHHKVVAVPAQFRVGFLGELDSRTNLSKVLHANYEAVVADVGGQEGVGHVKGALVEKFVWLGAILQTLEHDMVKGNDKEKSLGTWIQGVNSLIGLAKVLGVECRAKSMPWLAPALPNGDPAKDKGRGERTPAGAQDGAPDHAADREDKS